jgi:hypothetical protein
LVKALKENSTAIGCKIELSFLSYLLQKFMRKLRNLRSSSYNSVPFEQKAMELELFEHARQRAKHYLSTAQILRRLCDIDKLKLLILTPDQVRLFNSAFKPVIACAVKDSKFIDAIDSEL